MSEILSDIFLLLNRNSLILLTSALITVIWYIKHLKYKKLPPGPIGLPVVGYLPFLKMNELHKETFKLGKKYGDIFSIKLGSQLFVMLTTSRSIKEAFSKSETNGRPKIPFSSQLKEINPFFENGEIWWQHRKLLIQSLRLSELSKLEGQDCLYNEIPIFLEDLAKTRGSPVLIRNDLALNLSNIVFALLIGEKFNAKDLQVIIKNIKMASKMLQVTMILLYFPWVEQLSLFKTIISHLMRNTFESMDHKNPTKLLFRQKIQNQQVVANCFQKMNFTQHYLASMPKTKACGQENILNETNLITAIGNIYGASLITLLSTLEWSFYILADMPQVQKCIQDEIDVVIGKNTPTATAQRNMPLIASFIMEVQRFFSVVQLNVPKMALQDVHVMGYLIPKGTCIISNYYACHHDPKYWENPEKFKFDRFLDPTTGGLQKCENHLPFSFGKRNCPGEELAKILTFLYLTNILQKFNIRKPSEQAVMNFKGITGTVYEPQEQMIRFISRNT